ncbi:MAG: tyrosine-type recombinase/integrase [Verrucomicrobia bacterium]|nr:tyrosine-type recombinase/integrase [Verrucomicrobiota bacterium]
MKRRHRRIETVRDGNVRVKIYRRTRTVAGNAYPTFEVCDYTSGERKLRSFADHQAARKEARRIAQLLAKGDAMAAALSGREAAVFGRCLELLRSVGDPPELACARYAEAVGILGNGSLLPSAARFYIERHPDTLPQITLADAAAEMIELRRKAKASEPYLADLRCRTSRFIKVFPDHPASLTTEDCQRYLDGLEGTTGTKNAHRQILWRLFAYCDSRGYIARGTNPVAGTQVFTGKHQDTIEVWAPEQMAKLLAAADHAYLPALAIGAFAGLRTSEILALDWRDVRLADRTIKVVHRKARCAGTRLAPITDNLFAWLSVLAKKTGPVWPRGREWKERERTITAAQNATAAAAGLLPWRHNGLRQHAGCRIMPS